MLTISSVTSPEPNIVSLESNSNEPTISYAVGNLQPIALPSLNELTLPPNQFNLLAIMAVMQPEPIQHDGNNSPQSRERSDPSPISTPRMNLSKTEGWETPHTTIDDDTFSSEDEPRKIYLDMSSDGKFHSEDKKGRIHFVTSPSTPAPTRKLKRKLRIGMSLPKKGVSQHVCQACGQTLPPAKDIHDPSTRDWKLTNHWQLYIYFY